MTPQCAVFIATSLDGCIARPDGNLDWLDRANTLVPEGEDCGYADFLASVDLLVMGRGTFEKVLSFPEWPYGGKPVWVLSQSLQQIPSHLPDTVRLLCASPTAVVARAKAEGFRRLYIDGGKTIQAFLAAGHITDMTVTVIPVLIGSGLPLFGPTAADIPLAHVVTHAYPFGFVQSRYAIRRGV